MADPLADLIADWRKNAKHAEAWADAHEAQSDGANAHAFRKERRIWNTCASQLEFELAEVAAVRGAEAPAAITESEKRGQTSDWIVVVGKGSWAKCYGPFAKHDDAIAWCKANQYIEADSYETYPVNPPGLTPPSDQEQSSEEQA